MKGFQSFRYRLFPPKVKLLTELEFIEQGHVETKKALEDLRKYCSSPDCNVWKTVTRLKDPIRYLVLNSVLISTVYIRDVILPWIRQGSYGP